MRHLLALVCFGLAMGCVHHKPIKTDTLIAKPIIQQAFTAIEVKPRQWLIWIRQPAQRVVALSAIGCGSCAIINVGYVLAVERKN